MAAVSDTFGRTVSGDWGTANTGQVWTVNGGTVATDYLTNGSVAQHSLGSRNVSRRSTIDAGGADVDVVCKIQVPVLATGAAIQTNLMARFQDASNYYLAELLFETTQAMNLSIRKDVAATFTTLVGPTLTGLTHTTGDWYWLHFQVSGSTLRARAWLDGATEPTTWLVETTDTAFTTGGNVGVRSNVATTNTNTLPVITSYDTFTAAPLIGAITATEQDVSPPRVLVSVTGVAVGSSIELFRVVGGERTEVRAGSDDSVPDTSLLRVDAEIPFGVPVSYVAVINGTAEYTTSATTYTLTGGKPVITDAISGLTAEAVILAWDEKRYNRRTSVFQAGGRNVVVSDDWGMFDGTIEFFTEATSSRDNLMEVLTEATEGVVQLRQPGGYDGVDSYLAVIGTSERRWSQDGSDQRRVITAEVVETDSWAPALEARGFTLQDIYDLYGAAETVTLVKQWTFASTTESWTASSGSLARVATPSNVGDGSLRLTPSGVSLSFESPLTPLGSGEVTYRMSVRLYSQEGLGGSPLTEVALRIYFFDGVGTQVGVEGPDFQPNLPATTWATYTQEGFAPATATQFKIRVSPNAPAVTNLIYLDWAKVEALSGGLVDLDGDYATLLDIAQADLS